MSNFQVYVADAIDLMRALPDESIDLIVTDTAYESLEKHRAVGTTTRLKQSAASSNEWFPIFRNSRFDEFFSEAFRVLKKNAHLYFYCDHETAFVAKPIGEEAGFKFWKPIVWAKTKQGTTIEADSLTVDHQAIGMGYHYRASYEFVLFFEKGKRMLTDLGVRDVLPFPSIRNGYPTEKPTDLNRVFVRLSSEQGETVLDPFMGSASTGVAAVRNGRHFIGGDIKESAVADARERLVAQGATDLGQRFSVIEGARRPEPEPQPKKTRARRPEKSDKNGAQLSGESAETDAGHRGNEPETVSVATPESAEIGEVAPYVHIGKYMAPDTTVEEFFGPAHQHDHTCDCPACERERRVPRAFEVEVSDEPLPRMEGPGVVAMLEETFAKTEAALLDGLTEAREEAMRRLQDPPEVPLAPPGGYGLHTGQIRAPMFPVGTPQGPPGSIFHLDGDFAVDPLPGGPTTHLAGRPPGDCDDLTTAIATSRMAIGASAQLVPPDPVPPPRPPSCPHGDLRSACVLCRSRR